MPSRAASFLMSRAALRSSGMVKANLFFLDSVLKKTCSLGFNVEVEFDDRVVGTE